MTKRKKSHDADDSTFVDVIKELYMIVETVLKDGNIQVNALKKIPEICHTTDVAVTKRRYENIIPFLFFSFYFSFCVYK